MTGIQQHLVDCASLSLVYHNNFYQGNQYALLSNEKTVFSLPLPPPAGGGSNWWKIYDEAGEGCTDENSDRICDAPFTIPPTQTHQPIDHYPWTARNAWESAPIKDTLSLPTEAGYDGVRGVRSSGPYPERGVAEKDTFTFKVVYTDPQNRAPDSLAVHVGTSVTDQSLVLPLTPDPTAPEQLRDGNFTNGEQYTLARTFPKDKYFFSFRGTATDGTSFAFTDDNPIHLNNTLTFQAGYSSIIFLPGIKGSELCRPGLLGTEDKLWFPSTKFSNDVRQLAMNAGGESQVMNIYTRNILENVLSKEIYRPFVRDYLHKISQEGLVQRAVSFPYDWRYDVLDIVDNPVQTGNGMSYSMPNRLREIATSSDSGQVIVIGHSNGGLVGKALIATLVKTNHGDKIEKFVMVGVPQLGTPDTIAGLLHGHDQSIKLFVSTSTARVAGHYMLGAYGLLPIGSYTLIRDIPLISFDESPFLEPYRNTYGTTIENPVELKKLLAGAEGRAVPDEDSLNEPIILASELVDKAAQTRQFLESWTPPPGLEVIEFAGGNLPTISSIQYKQKAGCTKSVEKCLMVDPRPNGTGDGTVVLESAQAQHGAKSHVIDMWEPGAYQHFNMLNNPALQDMLRQLITTSDPTPTSWIYPKGTSLPAQDFTVLQTFSPVAIEVSDAQGNKIKREYIADSDIDIVVQDIPNAQYYSIGDMQMVIVPSHQLYTVQLSGTGTGTLQLELEQYHGTSTVAERIHTEIPVTPKLVSIFTLTHVENIGTIELDADGDGISDMFLTPPTPEQILQELKAYINALSVNLVTKNLLLLEVRKIETALAQNKIKQVLAAIKVFKLTVDLNAQFRALSQEQRKTILRFMEQVETLISN